MLRDSKKDLDLLEGVYGALGEDIVEMEETFTKEGDDIEAMERAYNKKDLPTLVAAYDRAGEDLTKLSDAHERIGEEIETMGEIITDEK